MGLGIIIGAITFSGSVIAFGKLQAKLPPGVESALGPLMGIIRPAMSSRPIMLPGRHVINGAIGAAIVLLLIWFIATEHSFPFVLMTLLAFAIGFLLIIPIGGADMPVVVSMLNSYSGWAAAGIGFTLKNPMLIVTGALVGSSGAILSYIMCRAMNRSFISVILGGFGETAAAGAADDTGDKTFKAGSADDAAFIMENAQKVIIVPGYGMAVSQAQHAVRELYESLTKKGVDVAVRHPPRGRPHARPHERAAGRGQHPLRRRARDGGDQRRVRPGRRRLRHRRQRHHQPSAKTDTASPIYGMPVLDVDKRQGGVLHQALDRTRLCRHRQSAVLHGPDHDAVRRRQEDDRGNRQGDGSERSREGSDAGMCTLTIRACLRLAAVAAVCAVGLGGGARRAAPFAVPNPYASGLGDTDIAIRRLVVFGDSYSKLKRKSWHNWAEQLRYDLIEPGHRARPLSLLCLPTR